MPIPSRLLPTIHLFSHLYLLPIVGLIRGALVVMPLILAKIAGAASPQLLAFGAVALHFVAQGFLHADGLIDFSEAILAHRFGVEGYKVIKDRYRGSYAIAAFSVYIIGLFSATTALLERLPLEAALCLLLLSEVWSTNTMLLLSRMGKEPPEGFGRTFKRSMSPLDAPLSLLLSLAVTVALAPALGVGIRFMVAIVTSLILTVLTSRSLAHSVLGFVNGDVLGFSSELYILMHTMLCWALLWI